MKPLDTPDDFAAPSFARVEISLAGKASLKSAATELRDLATQLETVASKTSHSDPTANYLAWGRIKSASRRLRG